MTPREELRELYATIEALTGRRPTSTNATHLRRRLAELCAPQPVAGQGGFERMTLLLTGARASILRALAAGTSQTPADVLVRALDEHAVSRGFGWAVERAKKTTVPK